MMTTSNQRGNRSGGYRGPRKRVMSIEPAQSWIVVLPDGTQVQTFHPPMTEGEFVTWAEATAKSWGSKQQHANSYAITYSADGIAGILVTHFNGCLEFATLGGCHRHDGSCRYYHFRPGIIVSNLAMRKPEAIGKLSPEVARLPAVKDLIKWRFNKLAQIAATNASQMDARKKEAAEAKRERAMRKAQFEEYSRLAEVSESDEEAEDSYAYKRPRLAAITIQPTVSGPSPDTRVKVEPITPGQPATMPMLTSEPQQPAPSEIVPTMELQQLAPTGEEPELTVELSSSEIEPTVELFAVENEQDHDEETIVTADDDPNMLLTEADLNANSPTLGEACHTIEVGLSL